ncbi:uncharacterized protein [Drosophila takahashii]|uniref:uncharacterized protein n=1 Tax=Drosophila takahashii TaxID=29030 RepID=UPI003898F1A3
MALLSISNNNNSERERDEASGDLSSISRGRSPGRHAGESSAATEEEESKEQPQRATSWKKGARPPTSMSESREERGRERGMVNRLGRRFRRYCKFLAASHGAATSASPEDEAEGEEMSSMEQLTGSRSSSRSRGRRRRSSSIGSASSRLKMRLRRCTSSPG